MKATETDVKVVENLTPWRLVIETEGDGERSCVLGPQVERDLTDGWETADLAPWLKQDFVRLHDKAKLEARRRAEGHLVEEEEKVEKPEDASVSDKIFRAMSRSAKFLGYAFLFFFVVGITASTVEDNDLFKDYRLLNNDLFIFAFASTVTFFAWVFLESQRRGDHWGRLRRTRIMQNMSLVAVVAIAALGPILARQLAVGEGLLLPLLIAGAEGDRITGSAGGPVSISEFQRLGDVVLIIFLVVASLLPAMLYYLFDRQQIGSLRRRFFSDAIRLDRASGP